MTTASKPTLSEQSREKIDSWFIRQLRGCIETGNATDWNLESIIAAYEGKIAALEPPSSILKEAKQLLNQAKGNLTVQCQQCRAPQDGVYLTAELIDRAIALLTDAEREKRQG